jgi:hypothetical protein
MSETTTITFEIVPAGADIAPEQKQSLERSFLPSFQELERLRAVASSATTPLEARSVRLELVKVRTGAERVRKELKEASIREGKAIDGANAILLNALVPVEKAMENIEKEAERKEATRIAALVADRTEKLNAVGAMVPLNLAVLTDDQFAAILKDAAELQRIKAEREAQEEAERLAKIEADRLARIEAEKERARIAEENARLKAEADRVAKERAEEARKAAEALAAQEAKAKAERDKQAAIAKAEADRAAKAMEAERRKAAEAMAEQKRKAEEEMAEILAAQAEQNRIAWEAEQARAEEAEAQLRAAEKAKAEQEAAAAKLAAGPLKDKLVAWVQRFPAFPETPEGVSPLIAESMDKYRNGFNRALVGILKLADKCDE